MNYVLTTFAQEQVDKYLARIAALNGVAVDKLHKTFAVAPAPQQSLEKAIQESVDFFKLIQNIGVVNQKGDKLGLAVASIMASRTNTGAGNRRNPQDRTSFNEDKYECVFTEYDSSLPYAKLDAWAHLRNFQQVAAMALAIAQALTIIMVGFNGTGVVAQTNSITNPLGQDVNIGWLEKIRLFAPTNHLSGMVIKAAGGGDYRTLDGLVTDMRQTLIHPRYRNDPQMVAIIGRGLMNAEMLELVDNQSAATEKLAADVIVKNSRVGGLPWKDVPHFPDDAVLITRPDNLSRYYQLSGRRRHVKDEPEYSRLASYDSSNDAYVVEEYECAALADGITRA